MRGFWDKHIGEREGWMNDGFHEVLPDKKAAKKAPPEGGA